MINNVAFTGREAMLGNVKSPRQIAAEVTKQIEKAYTGVGKRFSTAEIEHAENLAKNAKMVDNTSTMNDRIESYVVSHQPIPNDVSAESKTVNFQHIDFFA